MTLLSIDDLITPVTEDQVLDSFIRSLVNVGIPADKWRRGGTARVILRTVAKTYAGFSLLMSDAIKSGFLDLATGGWLTLHARYVFGVERIDASLATASITISNAGGGVYSFAAGALVIKNGTTGKTYVNTGSIALGALTSVSGVPFIAQEAGSASSSGPDAIDSIVTVISSGVTVANPAAAVGRDAQTDEELRQTCRDKLGSLSPNGPRDAYAYAVRVAARPDGSHVDINRMAISADSSTGVVTIVCASPSGAPTSDDLDYVSASIEAIARPDSVTVNVSGAVADPLTQSIHVYAETTPGLDAATLKDLIDASLLAMITEYPIGGLEKPPSSTGYLFKSKIEGAVHAAHPSIYDVDNVADLAIAPGAVATLHTTIAIRLVPKKAATV